MNNLPVVFVDLPGVGIVVKEKKWGMVRGSIARVAMVVEFLAAYSIIFSHREEFKKNCQKCTKKQC